MKFCLPDIGEGIKDVTITDLLVKEQQNVKKNDTVLIVESDKASMEIPIKEDCIIKSIHIKVGDTVSPGDLLFNVNSINNKEISNIKSNEQQVDKNKIDISTESKELAKVKELTKEQDKEPIIYTSPSVRKLARELRM